MKHFVLLFACFYLTFLVNVSAQNVAGSVEVGVYSAYQRGTYSGGLPIGDANNHNLPYLEHGKPYEITTFGGIIEYHLGAVFSLVGISGYEKQSLYLSVPAESNYYRASDSSLHHYDSKFTSTLDINVITTSILGKTTFPGSRFSILFGGHVSIVASNSQEIRYYLFPEAGYPLSIDSLPAYLPEKIHGQSRRYLDDSHTATSIYTGEIDNRSNTFLVGFSLGLQYDIPVYTISESEKRYITLTPTFLARQTTSNISKSSNSQASAVNLGLALKVGL